MGLLRLPNGVNDLMKKEHLLPLHDPFDLDPKRTLSSFTYLINRIEALESELLDRMKEREGEAPAGGTEDKWEVRYNNLVDWIMELSSSASDDTEALDTLAAGVRQDAQDRNGDR